MMQLLIERGAITTATDHNSSTPLHLSCLKGHQKCTVSVEQYFKLCIMACVHGYTYTSLLQMSQECFAMLIFFRI